MLAFLISELTNAQIKLIMAHPKSWLLPIYSPNSRASTNKRAMMTRANLRGSPQHLGHPMI